MPAAASFTVTPMGEPAITYRLSSYAPVNLGAKIVAQLASTDTRSLVLSAVFPLDRGLLGTLEGVLAVVVALPTHEAGPFEHYRI